MREIKKPFCDIPTCKYHKERYYCTSRRKYWSFKNYKKGYGFERVYREQMEDHFLCNNCAGVIKSYKSLPVIPLSFLQQYIKTEPRRIKIKRKE